MAALLVERSFVDLKNQVTVNGQCSISSTEVKCLLSDDLRAKVWAATPLSFSLWLVSFSFIALFFFNLCVGIGGTGGSIYVKGYESIILLVTTNKSIISQTKFRVKSF